MLRSHTYGRHRCRNTDEKPQERKKLRNDSDLEEKKRKQNYRTDGNKNSHLSTTWFSHVGMGFFFARELLVGSGSGMRDRLSTRNEWRWGVYRTSPRSATQKRRIRDVFFSSAKETAKAFDALNALFCGFDFSRVWNPSNVFPFLHYSSKRNFTAGWLFKTYGFVSSFFSFFLSLSLSLNATKEIYNWHRA